MCGTAIRRCRRPAGVEGHITHKRIAPGPGPCSPIFNRHDPVFENARLHTFLDQAEHARVIDPMLQETDQPFLTGRVEKLRISAQIGDVRVRVAISAPQRRQKHLQSKPTMEPFGHQAIFSDPPMRSSASNAYKRVASRRFRLSYKNDKAGKYALPRVGYRTQARLARAAGLSKVYC
jgi:hypothetical protein